MNILFLEDQASATEQMEFFLSNLGGYTVFSAGNIYQANKIINDNRIDCYVIDLNISPNGLDDKRKGSKLFPGWLWILDHYLLIEELDNNIDKTEIPVIIYSEFINVFEKQHVDKIELNEKEWAFFDKILRIRKFDEGTSAKLFEAIDKIYNKVTKNLL